MDARSRSLVVAALISVVSSAAAARAQEPSEADRERRARVHFESATVHFETGDYESALEGYRAAYAESPHPELLYNVFLCEERLGNLAAAVEALEGYLASETVPNRAVLERRLAHLRERRARGETRIEDVPDGPPGSEPAGEREVVTEPAVEVADPGLVREPAPGRDDTVAIAGFSIAAVGVVGFAIAGGLTLAEDGRLREACAPGCPPSELGTIGVTRVIADVAAGVALAGAIVGVIGLVIAPGASEPDARAGLRLRGLGLEGTF